MTSSLVLSESQFRKRWTALLKSTLETWVHQLLFVRRVYPRESFGKNLFLGLRVSVNRHPDVIAYVSKAVEVAVSAIVDQSADKVSLNISDTSRDGAPVCMEFRLQFSKHVPTKHGVPLEQLDLLERSMRDLIVSTYSLESERSLSESATFGIQLHILAGANNTSSQLNRAFHVGEWRVSERNQQTHDDVPVTSSILEVNDASVGTIQFAQVFLQGK